MNKRDARRIALDFAWKSLESDIGTAGWEEVITNYLGHEPTEEETLKVQAALSDISQRLREQMLSLGGK